MWKMHAYMYTKKSDNLYTKSLPAKMCVLYIIIATRLQVLQGVADYGLAYIEILCT